MFVKAIETAAAFTRPIHIITCHYGSQEVQPGAATLFFVNADGWALTCRHVARHLIESDQLAGRRQAFLAELQGLPAPTSRKAAKKLAQKHGFKKGALFDSKSRFVNCVDGPLKVEMKLHSEIDVALLHFQDFTTLGCTNFPTFAADGGGLKQGRMLCRLGFPFPEFTNFEQDPASGEIRWTDTGKASTPQFPIEGMVTRYLLGPANQIIGVELSTPGLRGQSGGPAFDTDGRVWGMQASTGHLDLDFDIDQEVRRGASKKRVTDSAFLHVGHSIHVTVLKEFMETHGVAFDEG